MRLRPKRRRLALLLIGAAAVLVTSGLAAAPASAATTPGPFAIAYQGGLYEDLMLYSSGTGQVDTGQCMYESSDASITFEAPGVYEVAYQDCNGDLDVYFTPPAGNLDTGLPMAAYTAPSVSANGVVAFQGSNGDLWVYNYNDSGTGYDTGHAMSTDDTSPSISADGSTIAFRAANGHLAIYTIGSEGYKDTGLGIEEYSRPSIGLNVLTCCVVAFQANSTQDLWYYDTYNSTGHNTKLEVQFASSPSISLDGGIIAYEGGDSPDTNDLWYYNGSGHNTGDLMQSSTSPSAGQEHATNGLLIGYMIAYQNSGGALEYYSTYNSPHTVNTNDFILDDPSYVSGTILDIDTGGGGG
jgi:hypothetical protein